ncbi:MAG: hypothetical protein ACFB8W_06910 [Elainellaceae cyanobacterium]
MLTGKFYAAGIILACLLASNLSAVLSSRFSVSSLGRDLNEVGDRFDRYHLVHRGSGRRDAGQCVTTTSCT